MMIVNGEGEDVELRRVVVDFVLNWEPTSTTPVDWFARYYAIQRIRFDRWNSAMAWSQLYPRYSGVTDKRSVPEPLATAAQTT
jgi:hypothetical protein